MKNRNIVFIIIAVILALSSCYSGKGGAGEISIIIDKSDRFSDAELKSAVEVVTQECNFPATTLKKISYIKEYSDGAVGEYEDVATNIENVIVLQAQFYVDRSGDNPVLTPGLTYEYSWVLEKDELSGAWKTLTFGI